MTARRAGWWGAAARAMRAMVQALALAAVTVHAQPAGGRGAAGAGVAAQDAAAATALVTALYREVAWQAVLETDPGAGRGLLDGPPARLGHYFDTDLVALVQRDHRCRARQQGVCALDFDPLWDSQDPVGTTVAVQPGAAPGEVRVLLRHAGAPQTRTLRFQLRHQAGDWRIADIRYPASRPSLKALLQGGGAARR